MPEKPTSTSSTPKPAPPPTPAPPTPAPPTPAPASKLLPASESGDVRVQTLLAERHAATLNGDKDEAKRVADALAELGYR